MDQDLKTWALPRIKRLLPLDDESLIELLSHNVPLPKQQGAEHLSGMLGDSPAALEFISSFNSRRSDPVLSPRPASPAVSDNNGVPRSRRQQQKKPRSSLHNAGPARRPEGYGDVAGGYSKTASPDALQLPRVTQGGHASPMSLGSRDASPAPNGPSPKLPPSASGQLISEFMPNVRSKQSKKPATQTHSGSSTPSHTKGQSTTTGNIADLTSAIAALELSTNPSLSTERRRCDCNASIHPLFSTAPNCLNCGKIICALEGLQPCSFCDAPILNQEEVQKMIKSLREERGVEKQAQHNTNIAVNRSGASTPRFGGATPDSGSGDEAQLRARQHRDKLLSFQRENAQRTKIHDEAADYDAVLTPGTTQWMSPMQRAAALKKQQAYLREMEEQNKPEWEKRKTVMSLGIGKGGKLVRTFERREKDRNVEEDVGEVAEEVEANEGQNLSIGGSGAFSQNPLLKGGQLVRPIWRPTGEDGKGKGRAESGEADGKRERKSVWRRVQDDNEDNEQWILDGGLRGYGNESRLMEDGSQQEHG